MPDLFQNQTKAEAGYTAKDIEVLEGLEPVRRRPGMYIGGTDERALHHLVAEVLDNAMDEAVAGHATRIEVTLAPGNTVTITDNGRGIPIDPHPKYKNKSALEVILTTLHSGGKFGGKVYSTSGGLHGVGLSVVNALAETLVVEVARERTLWTQTYKRGEPQGKLKNLGATPNRRGTTVTFTPDLSIFGPGAKFDSLRLYRMARSKAYLFKGVEIRWACDPSLLKEGVPAEERLHFPNGLSDSLAATVGTRKLITPEPFEGQTPLAEAGGRVEWAITWPADEEGETHYYCNTIPTAEGGTHEAGLRSGLNRALKGYGELLGNRKAANITAEDTIGGAVIFLSLFIREPQFQGQTKDKLASPEAQRLVEQTLKDHFEHWLTAHPDRARLLLERVIERAEERMRRRLEKEQNRKTATRKLRLPGKLADCSSTASIDTEIFLVEGDSAGGSAKQARSRETQAILPLRGKILNVASASADKLKENQELADLVLALGCGTRGGFDIDKLRYERVVIMTDADVDGAHIASLLMTFFYREMPGLIEAGRLYLAQPPLYRLTQGALTIYAMDDAHKDRLMAGSFKKTGKIEISRFKGLGEMPPAQLKETTMNPAKRRLLRVVVVGQGDDDPASAQAATARRVEELMGRKPELRFAFIQENAKLARDLDV